MSQGAESTSHSLPEADELVRRVLSVTSERTRSEAAAALEIRIRHWSVQTVRGARTSLARDFIEEAPAEVLRADRLGKYTPEQRFEGWCRTVLRRLWIDRLRQHRTEQQRRAGLRALTDEYGPTTQPHSGLEVMEDVAAARANLKARLEVLRKALDEIVWEPAGRVDHYAVLLLRLRLVTTSRVLAAGLTPADANWQSLDEWISAMLPWHEAEKTRRPAAELRPIGRLWSAFASAAERAEQPVDAQLMVAVINRQSPVRDVTLSQWYQWVRRARAYVRQHHSEHYRAVFATFLEPGATGDQDGHNRPTEQKR